MSAVTVEATKENPPQAGEPEGFQTTYISQGSDGAKLSNCEAIGQVARFTALSSDKPMGKRVWLEDGQLRKKVLDPVGDFLNYPVEVRSIHELQQAFMSASEKTVFVWGMHATAKANTWVRRNKVDFIPPQGGGVMFLDNDTDQGGDQFFDLYVKACPDMAVASYVCSPSSGAYIYSQDGEMLAGAKGQHYAVPVLDASDIERAINSLHERCVLAGLGVPVIRKNGFIKINSPVDTQMDSLQQCLFNGVHADKGVEQRKKPHIKAHEGQVFHFDTRLIKDLSIAERATLQAIEAKLRQTVQAEADAVREQWLAERAPSVSVANGVSLGAARAKLEKSVQASGGRGANIDLWAGMKIQFDKLGLVDVADVLTDPDKYHGQTCDDPMEPDYKPGTQVAVCYCMTKDGRPHQHPGIHSFAHGARNVYHLKRDLSHIDIDAAIHMAQGERSADGWVKAIEAYGGAVVAAGVSEVRAQLPRMVFRAGEFMSEMTPKFWILQRVLAKGWLYALAASPGAGKTAVALLLTLCAAMGREFMGRKVTRSKVLYLCGENPQDVRSRFDALLRKHEMTLADVEGQVFFTQSPFNIDDRQDLDAFIADAQQHGPFDLCLIDTQKAHSGAEDENDTSGQHELAQAMRRLGDGIGDPCILTLSHPTKNAGKDSLLPRGGSSFTGSIDGVICLWREGRGSPSEMFSHKDKFRGKAFEGEFFKMDEVEHPTLLDNFGDADVTVVASELTGQAVISGILKAVDNGSTAIVLDKIREACLRGELLSKTQWAEEIPGNNAANLKTLNGLITAGLLAGVPCPGELVGKRQKVKVLVPQSVNLNDAFRAAAQYYLAVPAIKEEDKVELQRIVQNLGEEGVK